MLSASSWRGVACGMAVMAVGLGSWSVYRDYCSDRDLRGAAAVRVAALEDSLRAAKVGASLAVDAMMGANAEREIALARYRAHQREDAHRTATDSGTRDSLRVVVAGAVASAGDSGATVDSLRRVVAVVVAAGAARGRVDSLAIVRLTGRLAQADSVIRADSVTLTRYAVALGAMERRATVAERLGDGYKAQRDAAARDARRWKLGTVGAGIVAVLALVR